MEYCNLRRSQQKRKTRKIILLAFGFFILLPLNVFAEDVVAVCGDTQLAVYDLDAPLFETKEGWKKEKFGATKLIRKDDGAFDIEYADAQGIYSLADAGARITPNLALEHKIVLIVVSQGAIDTYLFDLREKKLLRTQLLFNLFKSASAGAAVCN